MSIKRILIPLLAGFLSAAAPALGESVPDAARIRVRTLSVHDGLSSNCVYCVTQDRSGFIWFGTDNGVDRYDGKAFRHYSFEAEGNHSLSDPVVNCFLTSSRGELFVGTEHGLDIYDAVHDRFETFDQAEVLRHENIRVIVEQERYLLIGTNNGLYQLNREDGSLQHYNTSNSGLVHDIVRTIHYTEDYYFIGTFDGMSRLNRRTRQWTSVNLKPERVKVPFNNLVLSLLPSPYDRGTLLVGTQTGFCELDMETLEYVFHDKTTTPQMANNTVKTMCLMGDEVWMGTEEGLILMGRDGIRSYGHDPLDEHSLPSNIVWEVFLDSSHTIWLATEGGAAHFDAAIPEFRYVNLATAEGNSHVDVTTFAAAVSEDSTIWTGSRFGLARYDVANNRMDYVPLSNSVPGTYNFIRGIVSTGEGLLWVGTAEGVLCCDERTKKSLPLLPTMRDRLKYVNAMTSVSDGTVYASNVYGTLIKLEYDYDPVQGVVLLNSDASLDVGEPLSHIAEDQEYVWCASSSNKVIRFRKSDWYRQDFEAPSVIHALYSDPSGGALWLGCETGLHCYDAATESFAVVSGLQESVYAICSDSKGFIWFSTKTSVCCLDVLTDNLVMYPLGYWVPGRKSLMTAAVSCGEDVFFFGHDCLLQVRESLIPGNVEQVRAPIVLSEMLVNGDDAVSLGLCDVPLDQVRSIRLAHNQNSLAFNFAMLHYTSPSLVRYTYFLEGYDERERTIDGNEHFVEYNQLKPGRYRLNVKGASHSGRPCTGELSMEIRVERPAGLSWWALCLYLLAAAAVCTYTMRIRRRHLRVAKELEKERLEREKIEGLDQLKNQFFANISHDFKTPLTLILSPIESLGQEETDPEKREKLDIIRKNAYRLLKLVNQILDLKKADSRTMKLKLASADLVKAVREACESFTELAQKKHLSLMFDSTEDMLVMDFDQDCIDKIVVNLVSNAVKYTPDGGQVLVSLSRMSDSNVAIMVSDTGIGIPESELPMIFERFYQVEASSERQTRGTGLGLSIVKSLVELHKGRIEVKSSTRGTTFTVTLPVENERETGKEASFQEQPESAGRFTVLLVEDNPEMRSYLISELEKHYATVCFPDAESGFRQIVEQMPDIVVSDVMLPGMSGTELCTRIKSDPALYNRQNEACLKSNRNAHPQELTGQNDTCTKKVVISLSSRPLKRGAFFMLFSVPLWYVHEGHS